MRSYPYNKQLNFLGKRRTKQAATARRIIRQPLRQQQTTTTAIYSAEVVLPLNTILTINSNNNQVKQI